MLGALVLSVAGPAQGSQSSPRGKPSSNEKPTQGGALPEKAAADEGMDDELDALLEGEESLGGGGQSSALASWKGFVELEARSYLRDRDQGRNDEQLLVVSEFEFDFEFGGGLTGFFRPRIYVDALDGDLRRFEPFEAYATLANEDVDLRVGQFVENWGIVDTFNPIDVVSRRDFATDFLDPTRHGEFGARLRLLLEGNETIGEPTFSFYLLPVWRATPFAPEDQRFAFDRRAVPFDEDAGFEPSGHERVFYAARFNATLDTGPANSDVQVVVARGPDRFPTFTVRNTASGARQMPVYYGSTTVGAGFRAVPNEDWAGSFLATLTLKLEAVWRKPYRFDDTPVATPDDHVAVVAGVDRAFYGVLRNEDQLTMTLEYAREDGAKDLAGRLRPFRNDLVVRALWDANDFARTSIELRGLFDLDDHENIGEFVLERQLRGIHEDLKLRVRAQVFDRGAPGRTLFGFFPNNSSLSIALRWDL